MGKALLLIDRASPLHSTTRLRLAYLLAFLYFLDKLGVWYFYRHKERLGLLCTTARHATDGPTQMHLVDASVPGAGKGMLTGKKKTKSTGVKRTGRKRERTSAERIAARFEAETLAPIPFNESQLLTA